MTVWDTLLQRVLAFDPAIAWAAVLQTLADIDPFRVIWLASIELSVASIVTLIVLFLRRLIIQSRQARQAERRNALQQVVYAYLDDATTALPPRLSVEEQRILMGLVTEMMRGVTGTMREQLIDLLDKTIDQDRIVRALHKGVAQDRAKFAARLFWSKSPRIHEALRDALSDNEPEVVLAAANSLALAGQPLNLIELVPKFEARGMLGHRGVRAIFRKIAPQNVPALLVLMDDDNPTLAVLAIDALTRVPDAPFISRLVHILNRHASVDVRTAALRTLGLIGERGVSAVIIAKLKDDAWEVRAQAAIAVGRLRLEAAIPDLVALMDDSSWWVQLRSAQALARLGSAGEEALKALRQREELATVADFALAERHA